LRKWMKKLKVLRLNKLRRKASSTPTSQISS
jgi:hypothetical protein